MRFPTKQTALGGVLLALAVVLSYVESVLIVSPYGKIGLGNMGAMLGMPLLGTGYAFCIALLRPLIVSLITGTMSSLPYGLMGALCSFLVMLALYKTNGFSMLGIGVGGAMAHSMGQIGVAYLMLQSKAVSYYIAPLLFFSLIAGCMTGLVSNYILKWRKT